MTVETSNQLANKYVLTQDGRDPLDYKLYYTSASTFDTHDEILPNGNRNTIVGDTSMTVANCDTNGEGSGFMWVSVPRTSRESALAGTYTDTVTLTVVAVD